MALPPLPHHLTITLIHMTNTKDYAHLPLEALLLEEKKHKTNKVLANGLIGFLVGVMLYGVVRNGFGFLYLGLPLFLIYLIGRNVKVQNENLQRIRTAILTKRATDAGTGSL